ncbi:MAG: hypothetical protein MUF01_04695 [Bryobacterales bacterium]|jgi:hypothetical protein|nr:hypothetical protein [Bryobacterales bacterium]
MTQQQFANAAGLAIRSIAKYDTGGDPSGRALVSLARLAHERGHGDLAIILWDAFLRESGLDFQGFHRSLFLDEDSRVYRSIVTWLAGTGTPDLQRRFHEIVVEVMECLTGTHEPCKATSEVTSFINRAITDYERRTLPVIKRERDDSWESALHALASGPPATAPVQKQGKRNATTRRKRP